MFGTQEQTNNGPWLVKSGDRVLGPYTTEEVGRLLRAKEIVVIDEVISPQARWAYVRDVSAFNSVVEEIRRGQLQSREDTEIQGYTNTVIPPAPNVQTNPPASVNSEITSAGVTGTNINNMPDHTITEIGKKKASPASVNPIVPPKPLPPVSPLATQTAPKEKKAELKPLTVETPSEQSFVIRPHRRRAPGLVVGGLVLLLAAGFVVFTVSKKPNTTGPASTVSTENLETQASVAWKRGEFDRALELYRAIDRQQPKQPAVVARLALLMMQLEGQTVEAKRLLQTVSDKVTDMEAGSQIQIALGLASLHNEDGRDAVTRFSSAGNSWIASYDRGVALASLKEWPEAVKAFQEANDQPIALYMLARAQMSAADAAAKPALRKEAETTISRGLAKFADYKQELLVLGAYADLMSGNRKRAEARASQAVDTDPDQTPDHFHDPSLSVDAASWSNLVPMCREISTSLDSSTSSALMGICLAKANQLEDAGKVIEARLVEDATNPQLHAANAYLHMTADRDDAARASLTLASKAGNSRLSQILSSRLCSRDRQDGCAEEGWSKLAGEKDPPLAAYTGLAQIKFQKGDTPTGNALLVNAEKISPTYLPLLRLRQDASK